MKLPNAEPVASEYLLLRVRIMFPALCLLAVTLTDDPTSVALLETLPADGKWVKYDLRLQIGGQDHNLTWAARSVGNCQQGGRDLRCIETELTGGNDIPSSVHRMLVPVDAFGPGKHPLGQAIRMWVKKDNTAPESFDSISGDPLTALFLAGATEQVRRLPQKEGVNWQRGKLECDVFTGRSAQTIGDGKFL